MESFMLSRGSASTCWPPPSSCWGTADLPAGFRQALADALERLLRAGEQEDTIESLVLSKTWNPLTTPPAGQHCSPSFFCQPLTAAKQQPRLTADCVQGSRRTQWRALCCWRHGSTSSCWPAKRPACLPGLACPIQLTCVCVQGSRRTQWRASCCPRRGSTFTCWPAMHRICRISLCSPLRATCWHLCLVTLAPTSQVRALFLSAWPQMFDLLML